MRSPLAARMNDTSSGFTLVELMVAVAVVAILATIALPSMSQRIVRDQIVEAMKIADIAKPPIAAAWTAVQKMPADNAAAGLPVATQIVGNYVTAVQVENGAIHVTFGNKAHASIAGRVLSLRPEVVDNAPVVPIAWLCGHASPVNQMVALGIDRTTLDASVLPLNCRPGS